MQQNILCLLSKLQMLFEFFFILTLPLPQTFGLAASETTLD